MGFVNRLEHERRQMFATIEGPVTIADIRHHLEVERAAGGLPYAEVIDGRRATVAFSSADVRSVVAWLTGFARTHAMGPTAVLVSSPVAYGMMRMLEILAEDVCAIRPFLDPEEAEAWLRDQPRAEAPPGAGGTGAAG